jgi:hypothetical protein
MEEELKALRQRSKDLDNLREKVREIMTISVANANTVKEKDDAGIDKLFGKWVNRELQRRKKGSSKD